MACFKPLIASRSKFPNANGKYPMVFGKGAGDGIPRPLPCGQCIGCKLERSRVWGVRCMHEMQGFEENCFITLTYNEENFPEGGSINVKHLQRFLKRLRRRIEPHKVRFFACGEYGEKLERPHYHAILFGYDFPDKIFYRHSGDNLLYISSLLEEIWGMGFCTIGEANFETAAYVSRYCTKKITGEMADDHYAVIDNETGEIIWKVPEFNTMSRRPGIGTDWYKEFSSDVFPDDAVIVRGLRTAAPRFYRNMLEIEDATMHRDLALKRQKKVYDKGIEFFLYENTAQRLASKEKVKRAQIGLYLDRSYEHES